jgi:hypothetical protein
MGFSNQIERILHESSHLKIQLRLKKHQKTQKEIEIFCPVCGKNFNLLDSLRSHQKNNFGKVHHSESLDE